MLDSENDCLPDIATLLLQRSLVRNYLKIKAGQKKADSFRVGNERSDAKLKFNLNNLLEQNKPSLRSST